MAYKLSYRHDKPKEQIKPKQNPNAVDWGKVATVFMVFGLLSLLTAWVYSIETQLIEKNIPAPFGTSIFSDIPPIHVRKHNEVYNVSIKADTAMNSWAFIEGKVLNSKKEYLFSFGKELWQENGRDSDGYWQEKEDYYSLNVTFPKPGTYFLQLEAQTSKKPRFVKVIIAKRKGSTLPHLWFGLILLLIGVVVNEKKNRTIKKIFKKARQG